MNIFVHWINEDGGMYTLHNYDITTITPLFMTSLALHHCS